MNHYVAYHSVELMGHDYLPGSWFTFFSRKPEKQLRDALGGSAWVIVGHGAARLRRYRLAGVFTPSKLTKQQDGWAIEGHGTPFNPSPDLTSLDWFSALLAEQNKFSFGFNRVRDATIVAAFELASATREEGPPGATLVEGAAVEITVNAYERNPEARRQCIAHYGCRCVVCGFDFKSRYGEIGTGFIHVHHVVPLSEIGAKYDVDPVRDLRPVCPNCHAMIHQAKPPLGIEALAAALRV